MAFTIKKIVVPLSKYRIPNVLTIKKIVVPLSLIDFEDLELLERIGGRTIVSATGTLNIDVPTGFAPLDDVPLTFTSLPFADQNNIENATYSTEIATINGTIEYTVDAFPSVTISETLAAIAYKTA